MNAAKQIILENTFTSAFEIETFRKFIKEIFNEPEMLPIKRHTGIWREYTDHIVSYTDIARYTDNQGNKLTVLAVELKKDKSVERARSMQRNFISKVLDTNNLDAAIVAFYLPNEKNWRLSFVRLDYSFKEKIELLLTPAKRYSYLVGEGEPNHTAKNQLYPIFADDRHNPSIDEIEKAFSVERVTEEFFKQYKVKYIELKEYLEKNESFIKESTKLGLETTKFSEQFAKKLMGQLAFLYFLQKKGWLGVEILPPKESPSGKRFISSTELNEIVSKQDDKAKEILKNVFRKSQIDAHVIDTGILYSLNEHDSDLLVQCFKNTKFDNGWDTGSRTFIRDLFTHCIKNTNKNFFNDFLEPLFYDCLNKKRGTSQYYTKFNCKIPFLNGGLFEPLEGYHWKDMKLDIPHTIFSKTVDKNEIADGILDIFDRFNFTINEDEPLEKEVAVDPEMLGKIFENLLDVKDRKSKGAFYTPREIVHYMCQESLINYLINEVDVPYEDMKEFILYGELIKDADNRSGVGYGKQLTIKQTIYDKIVAIDKALKNVKVADPAVGSGAFPLGMLNEIVRARNNITEYIIKVDNEGKLDRLYGEDVIRNTRSQYKIKWETIKNSIFAVDIEPSAVDITKLRLWLSVVVDQDINEQTPEPHVLPNLDCNILVGNSLIDEYEGIKLFDEKILAKNSTSLKEENSKYNATIHTQLSLLVDHSEDMLKEMFELQDRYFEEDDEFKKKQIKERIDRSRETLIRYKLDKDNNIEGLKIYEESLKSKIKPYFIWPLEFAKVLKDNGGFDIVIGNPPYGAKLSEKEKDVCKKNYISTQTIRGIQKGSTDTYSLFIELGYNILKRNGVLIYIVPISITSSDSMSGIQRIIENNCQPIKISSYAVRPKPVFENAVVNTSIIYFKKTLTPVKEIFMTKMYRKSGVINLKELVDNLEFVEVKEFKIFGRYPKISYEIEKSILAKLSSIKYDIKSLVKNTGASIFYRTTGGRYFKVITNYSTGSTKEKPIYFDEKISNLVGAILSSNLFFWYYQIYSNNLDLKTYEIESFKIPLDNFDEVSITNIENAYSDYLTDIESNVNTRITTQYANIESFKEYKIGKSKKLIDKIDDMIYKQYGLSEKELEFIKKYEITYRIRDNDE